MIKTFKMLMAGRSIFRNKRGLILDAVTLACCAVVLFQLVRQHLQSPNGRHDHSAVVGQKIGWLSGQNAHDRRARYVVIAMSPGCPFCSNSAPFYRQLVSRAARRPDVHIIALMPPNRDLDTAYVRAERMTFTEFHYEPLEQFGIEGTPTLLVVDSAGRVVHSWEGQLNEAAQADAAEEVFG